MVELRAHIQLKLTEYECECSKCHRNFELSNETLIIEIERCGDVDFRQLRRRVASWLREECAFIVRCPRPTRRLDERAIIVTEWTCAPSGVPSRLALRARWSDSEPIDGGECDC